MATIASAQQRSESSYQTYFKWPGNSAAARAKRAAAAYLLSCPSLAAASSPVATAVRHELGASTQQVGLPPFRQLLQQDCCFNVQHALESEAWIELLPDRILQATNSTTSGTNSSDNSPPPLQAAAAPNTSSSEQQQKDALRAAVLLVWPGNSAAARAKRAAAAYLLSCPSLAAASSPVATAVRHELGASTQQVGLPPFRQLLQQDCCFNVQHALESEAWIELLPDRILQATNSTTSGTNSSDNSPPPLQAAAAPNTSSSEQQQKDALRAAVLLVWPGNSAAARAKRAAAAYLLSYCPSLAAASSPVATAVRRELGASTQQVGLPPFRQLLQQDCCFSVQHALESEAWIELLPDRLLQAAEARSSSIPPAREAPDATQTSNAQGSSDISAAVAAVYPSSGPVARVLRAAALFLAEQAPSYRANCARVAAAVDSAVGSPAKLGLNLKFKQIITADRNACFVISPSPYDSEQYVRLNVGKLLSLLHRMRQPPAAAAVPARLSVAVAAPARPSSSSGISWAAVASSSRASSSHAAAITSSSSSSSSSSSPISIGGNMHVLQDHFVPAVTLLPLAPPPPPQAPAAAAATATLHAAVLHAFQAAALALMPPASSSVTSSDDDVGVIFVPDDEEQLFGTVQPTASAAAVGELAAAQDQLACSREVQLEGAGQWPVLQQQVPAQWWT